MGPGNFDVPRQEGEFSKRGLHPANADDKKDVGNALGPAFDVFDVETPILIRTWGKCCAPEAPKEGAEGGASRYMPLLLGRIYGTTLLDVENMGLRCTSQ